VSHDYLGSVRQIVTDAANPAGDSRYDYTAYGLNDTEKDYSGLPFNAKCPYKFAGTWGYYDGSGRGSDQTADGMTLCGHRFYSPGIARWLTEDPIGFEGGPSLYAYCRSRPTASIDPTGTDDLGYGRYKGWIWHHMCSPDTDRHWYYPVLPDDWYPGWGPCPADEVPVDKMPRILPLPDEKWTPMPTPPTPVIDKRVRGIVIGVCSGIGTYYGGRLGGILGTAFGIALTESDGGLLAPPSNTPPTSSFRSPPNVWDPPATVVPPIRP
jgi:RHS repeat-associated protein